MPRASKMAQKEKCSQIDTLFSSGPQEPPVAVSSAIADTSHVWNHTVFVFEDFFIELSIVPSRFSLVIAFVRIIFRFKAEQFSFINIRPILCIQSSLVGVWIVPTF